MKWQIEPMPSWPYPKSTPKPNPFRSKWSDTLALLTRELDFLDVRRAVAMRVVATAADVRLDGMLRANAKVGYRGVVLSFESKHGPLSYPCDTFQASYYGDMADWQINLRAIALGLEKLRALDRYGITGRGEQYTGWRAIEAPAPNGFGFATVEAACQWLRSFVGDDSATPRQLLLRATATAHPDVGGQSADWQCVDAARQILRKSGVVP